MRFNFRKHTPPRLNDFQNSPETAALRIATPGRNPYSQDAIDFVMGHYSAQGTRRYDDVRVVAGELLANAAIHGNDMDSGKFIQTYCVWRQNHFYLAVQDEGEGFDIEHPPFVQGKSGVPPEGGLGLELAKQRADLIYTSGSMVVGLFREAAK